jgi:hypothetical protein
VLPSRARSQPVPRVPSAAQDLPSGGPDAAALTGGHVGSHSRYSAGCRCAACTAAHAAYLADWRAGRIRRSADAAPVRAHLQRLVASGLVLGYLADEAGVPRGTVYGLWHGRGRTSPATAAALLALRPLRVAAVLPLPVRELEALAEVRGSRPGRGRVVGGLDLDGRTAREAAAELGVSPRTVFRWRATQVTQAGNAARAGAAEGRTA